MTGGLCLLAFGAQAQIAFRASAQASVAGAGTPSFVASATNTANAASMSIARPAGVAQNDVLIAQITVKGVLALGTPAGWTLVNRTSTSTANNQITQAVYWRAVGVLASEPASYTFSWPSSARAAGGISAYRNADPVNPIDVSGARANNATATITLPTLTTTTSNAMLVALLGSSTATNNHGVPTGMTTEQYEVSTTAGPNGVDSSEDEQLLATPGSTGAKSATSSSAVDNIAHLLALRGSGSLTIAVPPGTTANDVMIASVTVRACSSASGAACTLTVTAPAGWTAVRTIDQTGGGVASGYGNRLVVFERVATAAEPASYTWFFGGRPAHAGAAGAILSFSGVDITNPIVVDAGQATASASTHATPSIDTGTVGNVMLVTSHSFNSAASWTPPAGMTERADIASLATPNDSGLSLEVDTQAVAAAGVIGARSATAAAPPAADTGATHALALRPAASLAHYAITVLSSTVANCDYAQVTISGHDASHNLVNPPAGRSLALSTSTGTGVWQGPGTVAGTGAWTPSGANNGAATYIWPGGQSSFTVLLKQSAVTSLSVNLNDGSFAEIPLEDPLISFVASAFRISNGANTPVSIGVQISGKPSNTGFGAQTLYLQALGTDPKTGACVSSFGSGTDAAIEVGAQCNNPAACGQGVTLVSTSAASNTATFVPNGAYPASMNFRFTTANAEAPFVLSYADAGQITLQFRRAIGGGQYMQGASNALVVRPFAFAFRGASAALPASHGTDETAPILAAAGDNFTMTVGAYAWAAGQDADNNGIADAGVDVTANGLTPNFAATTSVASTGNLPGVAAGALSRASGAATIAAGEWSGGAAAIANWRYSEVGNVFMTAAANNYLGNAAASVAGDSGMDGTGAAGGYIGRFRPKQFVVSAATLANRLDAACSPASTFTYMDEPLQLVFTLTAQNASGTTTQNYDGNYAKLDPTTFANWSLGARSGTINLTSRIDSGASPAGSWSSGVADVTLTTAILRATPDTPDGPYAALQFGIAPTDPDGTTMASLDFDADNNAVNERKNLGVSTEVRFGRLRMDNALGSEAIALPIPIRVEYWNGANFVANTLDSCTTLARSELAMDFSPPTNLVACETRLSANTVSFAAGVGSLTLTAPGAGNNGSVLLTANLNAASGSYCDAGGSYVAATSSSKPYLLGRWSDAADPDGNANTLYDDAAGARAGFGLYGSQPNNFIFLRERY